MIVRIAALVLALAAAPVLAQSPSARARLDAFAAGVHAMRAEFTQITRDARGDVKQSVDGELVLAAPRQFRWHTKAPNEQTIVADGARVWIHDPELEQVTVRRQMSAEAQSPLTVLTDLKQLDRSFASRELGTRDGLTWLELTPRDEDAEFHHAELGFDGAGTLAEMRFANALGGESVIRFRNWQRNPALAAGTFEFTPPAGTDVVGDTVEVPEVRALGD